jgi:protein-disulfide isomerase
MASGQAKRTRIRERREARARRQMLYIVAGVAVLGALFLIAFSLQQQTNLVAPTTRPYAEGKAMGPVDAPVLIEEYSDFQCPYCGLFAREVVQPLEDTYLKSGSGKVRFVYNHMAFLGQESIDAAEASECANEQDRFWDYANTLFTNQRGENRGGFNLGRLKQFAVDLNFDTDAFNVCVDSRRYRALVQQETEAAKALGITSTPSIFVNGRKLEGAPDFAQLSQMIEQLAAGQ